MIAAENLTRRCGQAVVVDRVIPVELEVGIPVRPTPAIGTIAYFRAAELLAKHSFASRIAVRSVGQREVLLLSVMADGTGGADPDRAGAWPSSSSGWPWWTAADDRESARRPTRVAAELPLRA